MCGQICKCVHRDARLISLSILCSKSIIYTAGLFVFYTWLLLDFCCGRDLQMCGDLSVLLFSHCASVAIQPTHHQLVVAVILTFLGCIDIGPYEDATLHCKPARFLCCLLYWCKLPSLKKLYVGRLLFCYSRLLLVGSLLSSFSLHGGVVKWLTVFPDLRAKYVDFSANSIYVCIYSFVYTFTDLCTHLKICPHIYKSQCNSEYRLLLFFFFYTFTLGLQLHTSTHTRLQIVLLQ